MKYLQHIFFLIIVTLSAGCADTSQDSYATSPYQNPNPPVNIGMAGTYTSESNPGDYILLQTDGIAYFHDRTGVTSRGTYHTDGDRLIIDYPHNSAIFSISGNRLILSSSLGTTIFVRQ